MFIAFYLRFFDGVDCFCEMLNSAVSLLQTMRRPKRQLEEIVDQEIRKQMILSRVESYISFNVEAPGYLRGFFESHNRDLVQASTNEQCWRFFLNKVVWPVFERVSWAVIDEAIPTFRNQINEDKLVELIHEVFPSHDSPNTILNGFVNEHGEAIGELLLSCLIRGHRGFLPIFNDRCEFPEVASVVYDEFVGLVREVFENGEERSVFENLTIHERNFLNEFPRRDLNLMFYDLLTDFRVFLVHLRHEQGNDDDWDEEPVEEVEPEVAKRNLVLEYFRLLYRYSIPGMEVNYPKEMNGLVDWLIPYEHWSPEDKVLAKKYRFFHRVIGTTQVPRDLKTTEEVIMYDRVPRAFRIKQVFSTSGRSNMKDRCFLSLEVLWPNGKAEDVMVYSSSSHSFEEGAEGQGGIGRDAAVRTWSWLLAKTPNGWLVKLSPESAAHLHPVFAEQIERKLLEETLIFSSDKKERDRVIAAVTGFSTEEGVEWARMFRPYTTIQEERQVVEVRDDKGAYEVYGISADIAAWAQREVGHYDVGEIERTVETERTEEIDVTYVEDTWLE